MPRPTVLCPQCGYNAPLKGLLYKCDMCRWSVLPKPPFTLSFDPAARFGWEYHYEGRYTQITDEEIQWLCDEGERHIPSHYYFEIRALVTSNFGQDKRLSWFYNPLFMTTQYIKYTGKLHIFRQAPDDLQMRIIAGHISGSAKIGRHPALATNREYEVAFGEEGDCHCHHSHYDHIGWRQGSDDKRVSCRIVGCGCECYTEERQNQYDPRF